MSDKIKSHVLSIAERLEHGFGDEVNEDGQPVSAFDYLQDSLDIEWVVDSKKQYLGARVLVAFGGPNIWVDTRKGVIEGAWWGDSYSVNFKDGIGLDDALQELYSC